MPLKKNKKLNVKKIITKKTKNNKKKSKKSTKKVNKKVQKGGIGEGSGPRKRSVNNNIASNKLSKRRIIYNDNNNNNNEDSAAGPIKVPEQDVDDPLLTYVNKYLEGKPRILKGKKYLEGINDSLRHNNGLSNKMKNIGKYGIVKFNGVIYDKNVWRFLELCLSEGYKVVEVVHNLELENSGINFDNYVMPLALFNNDKIFIDQIKRAEKIVRIWISQLSYDAEKKQIFYGIINLMDGPGRFTYCLIYMLILIIPQLIDNNIIESGEELEHFNLLIQSMLVYWNLNPSVLEYQKKLFPVADGNFFGADITNLFFPREEKDKINDLDMIYANFMGTSQIINHGEGMGYKYSARAALNALLFEKHNFYPKSLIITFAVRNVGDRVLGLLSRGNYGKYYKGIYQIDIREGSMMTCYLKRLDKYDINGNLIPTGPNALVPNDPAPASAPAPALKNLGLNGLRPLPNTNDNDNEL